MRIVRRGEPRYPAPLNDLESPPALLHTLGDLGALDGAPDGLVAIVGTREATPYGARVAHALATALAECGAVVVSGLARGVDAAGHRAALAAGGTTIAVLGTGVDVPYPAGNRSLHQAVTAGGLVISESPPGTTAFRGCFPRRNRIIAALARLTIVVEAGFKSGALNTATQALELGRAVAAVPGPIDSPKSEGCNTLIRDGAHIIASVDDAVALMGMSRKSTVRKSVPEGLDGAVWDAVRRGSTSVDAIAAATGARGRDVIEAIGRLEVAGILVGGGDGMITPGAAILT